MQASRICKEMDPTKIWYVNLLPWYDWIGPRIGNNDYADYLDKITKASTLDSMGYDFYEQQNELTGLEKGTDLYFTNLRQWMELTLRRPGFRYNVTQVCVNLYNYKLNLQDDFRWQISTAAADRRERVHRRRHGGAGRERPTGDVRPCRGRSLRRASVRAALHVRRGVFEWRGGKQPVMRLASSNPYRVKVNGKFAWYGPARGPKGYFRCDEIPLAAKPGANLVEIECAGYNCANFYFQKQPSFLLAEVVLDDGEDAVATQRKVVLRTAAKPGEGTLSAYATGRVRKVSRYSHVRAFGEAYVLPGEKGAALPLAVRPDVPLLPRIVSAPDFSIADDFIPVAGVPVPTTGNAKR